MRKTIVTKIIAIYMLLFLCSVPLAHAEDPLPIDLNPDISAVDHSSSEDISGACYYEEDSNGNRELKVNEDVFNHENILMGISDPSKCPLPGSKVFDDYPSVAGEFLFSGVVCITQSIILDSMFRVYCTLMLWMYQIIYAMMILYVMFYGMAIMFGLGNEPIKEIPKRILKMVFIFFFAVNAETGFLWIHKSFTNVLNDFSNILTRIQPLYTEGGEAAYRLVENENTGEEEWRLLAENGEIWKSPEDGSPFCEETQNGTMDCNDTVVSALEYDNVAAENYSPFRVPAQQWFLDPDNDWKLTPIFEEVTHNSNIPVGLKACISDYRWVSDENILYKYPRCQNKGWPTVPNMAPFETYCVYDALTGDPAGNCGSNAAIYYPPKLHVDSTDSNQILCDEENDPENCRQPFQGILGKIDAMFNSVVGGDNAKGIGAMIPALILTFFGGGMLLSMLLMSGLISMFVAFIQILWTYATSMMGLTFLMMLSPLFLSFALFKPTERLFRSWLGSLISFSFQPILILGFLYVLSSATTLDRLSKLAKHEVSIIKHEFNANDGVNKVSMNAPGFLEPLYEFPDNYSGEALKGLDVNKLITRNARQKFRERAAVDLKHQAKLVLIGYDRHEKDPNKLKDIVLDPRTSEIDKLFNSDVEMTFDSNHPLSGETRKVSGAWALRHYLETQPNEYGWLNWYVNTYHNEIGYDDFDGFPGEPANAEHPRGEYPTCKKYCPGFSPGYDATNDQSINPHPATCTNFCMYIYNNKEQMFGYLMGGILVWIVLNIMTGAFIARIPELAKRLANWQNMASQTPAIGGAGETSKSVSTGSDLVEEGTGGFTMKERTGVYHGGSIWGLGIGPSLDGDSVSRPGAIPAALEKMTRLQNTKYVDPKTGRIFEKPTKNLWDRRRADPYGTANSQRKKEVKASEYAEKARENLRIPSNIKHVEVYQEALAYLESNPSATQYDLDAELKRLFGSKLDPVKRKKID